MRKKILPLLAGLLYLSSCATIFGGKKHSIVVGKFANPNAEIFLDGKLLGKGPGKYKLKKGEIQIGSVLKINNGKDPLLEESLNLEANPAYVVLDFFAFGLGLIVDVPTGNLYRPKPRKFMTKK